MAFGRRRTTVAGPPMGATPGTMGAGPTVGRRRRGWTGMGPRRRRGAATAVASNQVVGSSATRVTDMRAASARRMSIAGAVVGEKFARISADLRLGVYTISHPFHPIRRVAAREQNVNLKAAATERKRQKIARAVDMEMRKRAVVREGRAARLQTAL